MNTHKEIDLAAALVIVGHGLVAAFLDGQMGLCAIQRLNRALLIHGKDRRILRGLRYRSTMASGISAK